VTTQLAATTACTRAHAGTQTAKPLILAILLISFCFAVQSASAQTFRVIYAFTGGADGGAPQGNLVQDKMGNFYGTTYGGGAHQKGVIFKISPTGTESVLYSFDGTTDAGNPLAGLVIDPAGTLYGTAEGGEGAQLGTVFKLTQQGQFTVLHTFAGTDGESPYGGLLLDSHGDLYGTTEGGGTNQNGTVYKIDAAGNFTTIYNFGVAPDGDEPYAGLIMDSAGNLYGTTRHGGTTASGTIYEIESNGSERVLASFPGGTGNNPMAPLVMDSAGNLYGTVINGGDDDCGAVFKLDTTHKLTRLYEFGGGLKGQAPFAGLVIDPSGTVYGTTFWGGAYRYGEVYKVTSAGVASFLYSFTGIKDGTYPYAAVIRDSVGNLYGTTTAGGPGGAGTVFKLTVH